eukprot:1637070-Amphidinium_carterae.1
MQLDTWGHSLSVSWHLHLATLLVPVGASEDNVREVLWFLFATHTERPHMKRTIRTNFMPYPSKGGVEALKALRKLSSVRLALFFRCR